MKILPASLLVNRKQSENHPYLSLNDPDTFSGHDRIYLFNQLVIKSLEWLIQNGGRFWRVKSESDKRS